MKRLASLTIVLALLSLPAATLAGSMSSTPSKNIVEVAASNPQLSTLVSLVKKAGLVKALSGTTKLTVFAPTNAAFAKVPKATLEKLGKDKALLKKVLLYHVLPGEEKAAQVLKLHSAKTLEGAKVKISVTKGSVYVNEAKVIKTNILASNGVIHEINAVLTPPGA